MVYVVSCGCHSTPDLCDLCCTEILFLAEWWSGSEVRVYCDEKTRLSWGTEHGLIIMNHTYEVDWLMGWMVADYACTLGVRSSIMVEALPIVSFLGIGVHMHFNSIMDLISFSLAENGWTCFFVNVILILINPLNFFLTLYLIVHAH